MLSLIKTITLLETLNIVLFLMTEQNWKGLWNLLWCAVLVPSASAPYYEFMKFGENLKLYQKLEIGSKMEGKSAIRRY